MITTEAWSWLSLSGTLSVASECGVTSNCKRSADYQSRAHWRMGDPGPAGYGWLFQRAVDKKTVVVADKGCRDTTSELRVCSWAWRFISMGHIVSDHDFKVTIIFISCLPLYINIFSHQAAFISSYSPKDIIPAAWIALAFANTHASSVGGLEDQI